MEWRKHLRELAQGVGESLAIRNCGPNLLEDGLELTMDRGTDERIQRPQHGYARSDQVGQLAVHHANVATRDPSAFGTRGIGRGDIDGEELTFTQHPHRGGLSFGLELARDLSSVCVEGDVAKLGHNQFRVPCR